MSFARQPGGRLPLAAADHHTPTTAGPRFAATIQHLLTPVATTAAHATPHAKKQAHTSMTDKRASDTPAASARFMLQHAAAAPAGSGYSFLQNSPQYTATVQAMSANAQNAAASPQASSSKNVPAAALPIQVQLAQAAAGGHSFLAPAAPVWDASAQQSRELDEEAISLFLAIEHESHGLPKDLRVRVERWSVKLSALAATTLSQQQDRDTYLRLLLDQIQHRQLTFPFDRLPDDQPLQRLPAYLNLATPLPPRNRNWHTVLHNLSASFLQGAQHRLDADKPDQCRVGGGGGNHGVGGLKEQQKQQWLNLYHTDHRSPARVGHPRRELSQQPTPAPDASPARATPALNFSAAGLASPYASPYAARVDLSASTAAAFPVQFSSPQPGSQQQREGEHGMQAGGGKGVNSLGHSHSYTPSVHTQRGLHASPPPAGAPAAAASPILAAPQPATNASGLITDVVSASMDAEAHERAVRDARFEAAAQGTPAEPVWNEAAAAPDALAQQRYHPFAQEVSGLRAARDVARKERDDMRVQLASTEFMVRSLLSEREQLRKRVAALELEAAGGTEGENIKAEHASLLEQRAQWAHERSALKELVQQLQANAAEREQERLSQLLQQRKAEAAARSSREGASSDLPEHASAEGAESPSTMAAASRASSAANQRCASDELATSAATRDPLMRPALAVDPSAHVSSRGVWSTSAEGASTDDASARTRVHEAPIASPSPSSAPSRIPLLVNAVWDTDGTTTGTGNVPPRAHSARGGSWSHSRVPASGISTARSPRRQTNPVGENGHRLLTPTGTILARIGPASSLSPSSPVPATRSSPIPVVMRPEDGETFDAYVQHFQRESENLTRSARRMWSPTRSRAATAAKQSPRYSAARTAELSAEGEGTISVELRTLV